MRILLCSHAFSPSIGGIETVSGLLAEEFSKAGAAVTVVTNTLGADSPANYAIFRRPGLTTLRSLGRGADVILQNNISLQTLLPLFSVRKPVVVAH